MKNTIVICVLFGVCYCYLPKIELPDVIPEFVEKVVPDVVEETLSNIPNPINVLFFNNCIADLGCFYTGPPFFHPTARPFSLSPCEPNVRFHLFTPSEKDTPFELELSVESLRNSTFNSELPTKLLIHGFRADVELGDVRYETKDALLKQGRYNVIIVDWTTDNGFPYAQAASNIRTNGARTAKLIHFLMNNTGIRAESIHIIGHSLGAHMAGYIGERVPHIGRISALDPAGPFFQGLEPEVRLDTTDALFVDVIHTDGGEFVLNGLGHSLPIGHIDFYPNGGRRQPGCLYTSESESPVGAAINFTTKWLTSGCDHSRANNLYLETIDNSECRFLAVQCSTYEDFETGKCSPENHTVVEMGYHTKQMPNLTFPVKFFLRTNGSTPFCIEDSILL